MLFGRELGGTRLYKWPLPLRNKVTRVTHLIFRSMSKRIINIFITYKLKIQTPQKENRNRFLEYTTPLFYAFALFENRGQLIVRLFGTLVKMHDANAH